MNALGSLLDDLARVELHELRQGDVMLAWLQSRPSHCDRGRYHAGVETVRWRSDSDPWPRYYFDLERAKLELEAYLDAKKVDRGGARWVTRTAAEIASLRSRP